MRKYKLVTLVLALLMVLCFSVSALAVPSPEKKKVTVVDVNGNDITGNVHVVLVKPKDFAEKNAELMRLFEQQYGTPKGTEMLLGGWLSEPSDQVFPVKVKIASASAGAAKLVAYQCNMGTWEEVVVSGQDDSITLTLWRSGPFIVFASK